MMDELAGIADAADENLAIRSSWAHQGTQGMRVYADHHLIMADSGLALPSCNTVCRGRFPREQAARWIDFAMGWFAQGAAEFTWWAGPADYPADLGLALEGAGMRPMAVHRAMTIDLRGLRPAELSPLWLDVRRVASVADLEAFASICAATAATHDGLLHQFFERAAPRLLAPESPVRYHVGYLDGVPVAGAEVVMTGRIAGFYGVATLEAHRGQGIGTAMALTSLLQVSAEGCLAAVVSTPKAGEGIFQRLGFASFGERVEYRSPSHGRG